jgi:hypothetical protein
MFVSLCCRSVQYLMYMAINLNPFHAIQSSIIKCATELGDNIPTSFITLTAAVHVQKSEMNSHFDCFITWQK